MKIQEFSASLLYKYNNYPPTEQHFVLINERIASRAQLANQWQVLQVAKAAAVSGIQAWGI